MYRLTLILCGLLMGTTVAAGERPSKIPILLDTDIGTDIDDAFALALILESPEIELLGLTTVSGDTEARARLAAKMLWEVGRRDVPIAAGEPGKPLPIEQTRWAQAFTSPEIQKEKAVDLLKIEIERRPGEITLVAIGPLTNVGALLKRYPQVKKKILRAVLMGGSIARGYKPGSGPAAEYNIASDPAAAQAVFFSGVPILMVPLDVTAMLQLDVDARHQIFTHLSLLTNALTLLYHLWNQETPTLFDPMAVALLIKPSLCEIRPMTIEVDAQGHTRASEGKPPNAAVALHTDPERFFRFYLSRVAP